MLFGRRLSRALSFNTVELLQQFYPPLTIAVKSFIGHSVTLWFFYAYIQEAIKNPRPYRTRTLQHLEKTTNRGHVSERPFLAIQLTLLRSPQRLEALRRSNRLHIASPT